MNLDEHTTVLHSQGDTSVYPRHDLVCHTVTLMWGRLYQTTTTLWPKNSNPFTYCAYHSLQRNKARTHITNCVWSHVGASTNRYTAKHKTRQSAIDGGMSTDMLLGISTSTLKCCRSVFWGLSLQVWSTKAQNKRGSQCRSGNSYVSQQRRKRRAVSEEYGSVAAAIADQLKVKNAQQKGSIYLPTIEVSAYSKLAKAPPHSVDCYTDMPYVGSCATTHRSGRGLH